MHVAALVLAIIGVSPSFSYELITYRNLVHGNVTTYSEDEEPWFLVPKDLRPGSLAPIIWREDGTQVDPESYLVGIPPKVTEIFNQYLEDSGLLDLARKLLYENEIDREEEGHRVYHMKDGTTWSASRPGNWIEVTDMVWMDAIDEWTYEVTLDLLRRGGFDVVLDALGDYFGVESLWIVGTGIKIVSKMDHDNIHDDLPGIDSTLFNINVPLVIPTSGPAQLMAGERYDPEQDEDPRAAPLNLRSNVGLIFGGDSRHGTGVCDYRYAQDFRISIAIYVVDLNEQNMQDIAGDTTSLFPVEGDHEWHWTQAGRHWSRDNAYTSLATDRGRRAPFLPQDEQEDCPALAARGLCDTNIHGVRLNCLKSCNIYMDDETYAEKFGKLMGWPTEDGS